MSLYSRILSTFGLGGDKPPVVAETPPSVNAPVTAPVQPVSAPGVVLSEIDVVAQLEALARSHPEKLKWKVSIVDLMKLLGLDSDLATRQALATELGCPTDKRGDSAAMNQWLHKAVFRKLAENGGRVPADLLD